MCCAAPCSKHHEAGPVANGHHRRPTLAGTLAKADVAQHRRYSRFTHRAAHGSFRSMLGARTASSPAFRSGFADADGQQGIVFIRIEKAPLGCNPSIQQPAGFQRRFDIRAISFRSGWQKIAECPQRSAWPVGAESAASRVRRRRRLVITIAQAIKIDSSAAACSRAVLRRAPTSARPDSIRCDACRSASLIALVRGLSPSGKSHQSANVGSMPSASAGFNSLTREAQHGTRRTARQFRSQHSSPLRARLRWSH